MRFFVKALVILLLDVKISIDCQVSPNYKINNQESDSKYCDEQIKVLQNSAIGPVFFNININLPRDANSESKVSLYHSDFDACLNVNEKYENTHIRGKYCEINVQVPRLNSIDYSIDLNETLVRIKDNFQKRKWFKMKYSFRCEKTYQHYKDEFHFVGRNKTIKIGICVPHACKAEQAVPYVLGIGYRSIKFDGIELDKLSMVKNFCRVSNDKPLLFIDYFAIMILILIIILAALGTLYERKRKLFSADTTMLNSLLSSFSITSNLKSLLNTTTRKGTVESVDGIRAISMLWVILLHTYYFQIQYPVDHKHSNFQYYFVYNAFYAVDTFLFLGGFFVVYSSIGKINRDNFFSSLPKFYLNRIIRLYPILCLALLLYVSLVHHVNDGPLWYRMTYFVDNCKTSWWNLMFFVQNYLNTCFEPQGPDSVCLDHLWYLSVDMQLYVLSPLILFFLIGTKRTAVVVITLVILTSVALSTALSFLLNFSPVGSLRKIRSFEQKEYMEKFYSNTFARSPPYFVGMGFGYLMSQMKDTMFNLNKYLIILLWAASLAVLGIIGGLVKTLMNNNFDNQTFDNLFNGLSKTLWSIALGWIVLACHHGYGGLINKFLSLKFWKIFSKLSYPMYVCHIIVIDVFHLGNNNEVLYGLDESIGLERFTFITVLTLVISAMATVLVEMPIVNLYKLYIGDERKVSKFPLEERGKIQLSVISNTQVS